MSKAEERNDIGPDEQEQPPTAGFTDAGQGPGGQIGRFRIVQELGRGGMGVVYLAHDTKLDRLVAIKSLPPEVMDNPEFLSRWQREARLLASLNHPNIATIYEVLGEGEEAGYMVFEYVAGDTLAERIARGRLELNETLSVALQIAQAMLAAHEQGVIHRDLKPTNVKITPELRVKVLDFGLAKMVSGQLEDQKKTTDTRLGRVMGTPGYMSPEQALGKVTDHRSDIWSFGCVLYEMLTGSRAFAGQTVSDSQVAVLTTEPDWGALPAETGSALRDVVRKCLEKDIERRYQSTAELYQDLVDYHERLMAPFPKAVDLQALFGLLRRPRIAVCGLLVFLVLCVTVLWIVHRGVRVRWARKEAIPEIISLTEQDRYLAAFSLARRVEKYIPNDPTLTKLWPRMSRDYSILTTPPGAAVFFRDYQAIDGRWEYLGRSPLENIRFPRGLYRWKIAKEGFETVECIAAGWTDAPKPLHVELWQEAGAPAGMVRMPAATLKVHLSYFEHAGAVESPAYWIDKYEVTNEQFKEFVDNGGYEKQDYWKHKFIKDGRELTWQEAMRQFRDKTGRPAPSTWEAGTYPQRQEKYPVAGVSWYEAAAYAEFRGKSLPTVYHWSSAACVIEAIAIIPLSNFGAAGPAPVGSHPGIGSTGLYDMAGNVKEWCYNATSESKDHRYILGGAWREPSYMFTDGDDLSAWDRSPLNGFRCAQYPSGEGAVPAAVFRAVERPFVRDYSQEKPVSNEEFELYKRLYAYDRAELNSAVESVDDSSEHWRKEKITFDAAYGGERVIVYLFLPKSVEPPYQTVVYFPGAGALRDPSFGDLPQSPFIDFVIKSGRALLFPVLKGTYERRFAEGLLPGPIDHPNAYRDWVVQLSKDLSRSIDYLESRDDISHEKIAYYGLSWGARIGPIMLAIEERFKVAVFFLGGFHLFRKPPAVDEFNFARRVNIPVLMINGKEDSLFPLNTSQIPMYEGLGTDKADKEHKVYPGGHGLLGIFTRQIRDDVLGWLDRYLGPVD